MDFFTYIIQERAQIISLLVEHINLTLISVLVAILIGVPMGILISHFKKINKTFMCNDKKATQWELKEADTKPFFGGAA